MLTEISGSVMTEVAEFLFPNLTSKYETRPREPIDTIHSM